MRQRVDLDRLLGVAVDLAADSKIYKYHYTTHTHMHSQSFFLSISSISTRNLDGYQHSACL